MKDEFVHLHVHSEFSLLDGYGHPEQFVAQVKALGQTAIAITDHGNISSHFKWTQACKKEGIKPILGCEMYVVDDSSLKKDRQRNHVTVLAKNEIGLRNLYKLVTFSYAEGFYYKPRVDWANLVRFQDGLILTSSCPSGKTGGMVGKGATDAELEKELKWQRDSFEHWFVELCPWDYDHGKQYGSRLYKIATKLKLPMVMTMDCHYPCHDDNAVQDVLLAVQTGAKFKDPDRMRFDQKDFYVKSKDQLRKDWERVFKGLPFRPELISNTAKIADMVNCEMPKAHPVEFPYKGNKHTLLTRMVKDSMQEKRLAGKKDYVARMEYELKLIVEKKFVDYFLVVADLVNWAKAQGIFVGPARGSSCGSLVCWLLHITEVDPLKFGLLFERFIDVNRTDTPDIDIDFEDVRREEVKNYLRHKYGADHVSSLLTFNTFQGRMCLQDIGRVFEIPYETVEEVKRFVVKRSGGDVRYGFSIEDTFNSFEQVKAIVNKYPAFEFARRLEGQIRNFGQHAAAVVISSEPITNFAAFYRPKGEGESVVSLDAAGAEAAGLLKMDLLGLTSMTTIKLTLQSIKERKKKDIDLSKLEFNDAKVFKMFCKGNSFGVFQFDGLATYHVLRDVQPENFEQLVAINALARPGPLHSGGTGNYIARKNGTEKVTYDHPALKPITGETYGVTVYQEQVMLIVRNIGNFNWADTSTIRKTMSKSRGVESFNKFEAKFIEGAGKNGVSPEIAKKIWTSIFHFGSWAFNKSHAVAYTHISYWMMWLKTYYPVEFYCAIMQQEADEDKLRQIIKEAKREGQNVLGVDVNKSKIKFSIDGKNIRIGFSNVKGIGEKVAEKLVKMQPFHSVHDFMRKVKSESTIDVLMRIGACQNLPLGHKSENLSLFKEDAEDNIAWDYKTTRIEDVMELCSFMVQDEVCKDWTAWCQKNLKVTPVQIIELFKLKKKTEVVIVGRTDPDDYNAKNQLEIAESRGKPMDPGGHTSEYFDFLSFRLEDESASIEVRFHYKDYPKFKKMIWAVKPTDVIAIRGEIVPGYSLVHATSARNISRSKAIQDGKNPATQITTKGVTNVNREEAGQARSQES